MFQWKARMTDVLRDSYFKKHVIENSIFLLQWNRN